MPSLYTAAVLAIAASVGQPVGEAATRAELRAWGFETLARINAELKGPYTQLYADEARLDGYRAGPAFCWGVGAMLPALNAAARNQPFAIEALNAYGTAVEAYWNPVGPVPGYDVLPLPKPMDRYYDDNEWLVLAYLEAYEITRDPVWMDRAQRALTYVLSGWDEETLGGGIWWRENPKDGKNTCSNSPAAVACYRMAEVSGDQSFRTKGDQILAWTLDKLRDPEDGLMFDGMRPDGSVEKAKWTYNAALTIRALADASRDANSLAEAQTMARAALAHWQDPETGAIRDDAGFAHLLAEALLYVDERTGTGEFRPAVLRALRFLHDHGRDSYGHYPKRWDMVSDKPVHSWKLLEQAGNVRAFLLAALD